MAPLPAFDVALQQPQVVSVSSHLSPRTSLVLMASMLMASLGVGGCVTTMTPPERFLIVDQEEGSLRALTPEDSKIIVREFSDDSRGSLAFWGDALKADLLKNRGYLLIEESTIVDDDGHQGLQFVLETTLSGQVVRELMAVYVLEGFWDNTIRVAEFVADQEAFDAEMPAVRTAFTTIR